MAKSPQSGWLIEEGIGEVRALLVAHGQVMAAKIHWPGELVAGAICKAVLASKIAGARRGTVVLENNQTALVDHLPHDLTEGQTGQVEVFRAAISERGRYKLAQTRWAEEKSGASSQTKSASITSPLSDLPGARVVPSFEAGLWEEVWHAASSGALAFPGGEVLCNATPAMTLIDVDRMENQSFSANLCSQTIARAIGWFDLGGSIGIDFPTLQTKQERKAFDEALKTALAGWPHEATAMNGFGFVQLVARLKGPTLLHRFNTSRVGLAARFAMRVAERCEGVGTVLLLRVHPALKAKIKPEWQEEIVQRSGKQLRIETDPGLALEAPQAQILQA